MRPDDEEPDFYVNALCQMRELLMDTTDEVAERVTNFNDLSVFQRFVLSLLSISDTQYHQTNQFESGCFSNGGSMRLCWSILNCPNSTVSPI